MTAPSSVLVEPQETLCSLPAAQPNCQIDLMATDEEAEWDVYVHNHPDGTLFHTLAWRNAVRDTFGHRPLYWTAHRRGTLVGILPTFFVPSLVAGRMLISVPYAVGGGILADDDEAVRALFEAARRHAQQHRCRILELRSQRAAVPGLPAIDRYVVFRRDLPTQVDKVLGMLPRKARAAARNGRDKFGLTDTLSDEQLADVWRLYAAGMKRLASLNYPFAFFKRLIENTPDRHWVSVVRWQGKPVAGLVTFLFKDRVMPYFAGLSQDARLCCAGNFIYLSAMERGAAQGFHTFDFGRSRRDNSGSYDFKRFQGFTPVPLEYQFYCPHGRAAPNLSPSNPKFRYARRLWPALPDWFTQRLGARLTRHIPG